MQYQVVKTIDAVVRYVAEVEAESAEDAAKLAQELEGQYRWEYDSTSEYDARNFQTCDEEGSLIEETMQGDVL